MGSYSHTVKILCVEGGDSKSKGARAGTPHLRTFPFVHGRLTSGKDSGRRWPAKRPSVGESIQPVVCHSPVLLSLRCKGKEGIRGEHGPLESGGQQSEPQGRPWPVSHTLAGLGPASRPLCPKDAQHGWQLSQHTRSPSGGSCPNVLQIKSVSPACPPSHCSGAPTGAWHSVLPVRWLPVLSL